MNFLQSVPVKFDVIVIGAGAAGLFCAMTAGARGRRVLVLEHNPRPGEKIRISGGGRCNFTNTGAGPDNYLSGNPAFCRSALARFSPGDFLALVAKHRIAFHEKTLGQMFCDGSSRELIDMLLEECAAAGVVVRCGARIAAIRPGFAVETSAGDFECQSLVVATGGLSFAKLGASDFGYRIARQFGMRVAALRPGLVPLTLAEESRRVFGPLSGLSFPARTTVGGTAFEESLLMTHRGLSGPAALQISSYWDGREQVLVDLAPGKSLDGTSALKAALPRRFADAWCSRYMPQKPEGQWSGEERARFARLVHAWTPDVTGTEGYAKAEVTVGGVDTGDLSSKTMESRTQRGLFFAGEVVDVTGWLGGYNFQWAWASGHAAGLAA